MLQEFCSHRRQILHNAATVGTLAHQPRTLAADANQGLSAWAVQDPGHRHQRSH